MDSEYIFKVEPTGFPYTLNGGVTENGIKDDSKVLDLNNWKGGVAINKIETSIVEDFCGGRSGLVLHVRLETPCETSKEHQGCGRKAVHWLRGCRGNSFLKRELGDSQSKKEKGPFRDSLWIRGFYKGCTVNCRGQGGLGGRWREIGTSAL